MKEEAKEAKKSKLKNKILKKTIKTSLGVIQLDAATKLINKLFFSKLTASSLKETYVGRIARFSVIRWLPARLRQGVGRAGTTGREAGRSLKTITSDRMRP